MKYLSQSDEFFKVDGQVYMYQGSSDDAPDVMWGTPTTYFDIRGDRINEFYRDLDNWWYMPLDWVNFGDSKIFTSELTLFGKRYITMLYYSVLVLGGNEMGPVNEWEMIVAVVFLVISNILNALIFGNIASLVNQLDARDAARQEKLDNANTVMNNLQIDEDTQIQVREYYQKTQYTKELQAQFDEFLDLIQPSLKIKVQNTLFMKSMNESRVIAKVLSKDAQDLVKVKSKKQSKLQGLLDKMQLNGNSL
jgi:hypothetical protein